jgi:ABC-type oligopeptide transport system substrate-binding subunit
MRSALTISVVLSLLTAGGWWTLSLAAQDQKKVPLEEEDPKSKPLRKPPPIEEEEPTPKAKPPKPPEKKAPEPPAKPPAAPQAPGPNELAGEADRTNLPELQQLYRDLGHPHDEVKLKTGVVRRIAPLPRFYGPGTRWPASAVDLKFLDPQWRVAETKSAPLRDIDSVRHYEQIALDRVHELLHGNLPGPVKYEAAVKVLAAVLRFHRTSPERQAVRAAGWKGLDDQLGKQLLAVRKEQLQQLVAKGNWEDASRLADQLVQQYADPKVQEQIAQELARLVEQPLQEKKYAEVSRRLALLEKISNSAAEPIRADLRKRAQTVFQQAQEAAANQDLTRAQGLMEQARQLWPQLPGLRELRWQLDKEHPTLGVGVRQLPEYFSPATAVLDSERWAVELLFDSLVKAHDEPGIGQVYQPSLALTWPRLTPRGRLFDIDRDAHWSNDERVTEADVRLTLQLLSSPDWPGYVPEMAEFLEAATPGRDLFQVFLTLRQGFLDPQVLMTFKVLPASAHLESPDRINFRKFARDPVGSGPFQLDAPSRRPAEKQAGQVVFVANGSYRSGGKPKSPHIQEIRFLQAPPYPAAEFKDGRLHLLLDLTPKQVEELRDEKNGVAGTVAVQSLRNRRIYFLAVNHRVDTLRNENVRKAIAHAVNRTQILDALYPGDLRASCRPLNGPYPPGSWPCLATLPADPYQPQLARGKAEAVKQTLPGVRLTLKYSAGDPVAKQACERIQEQLHKEIGFELDLEERSPRELHDDVEVRHDYQLAYYHYDYPSEWYWLWPLFNPSPQAREHGRNFLGYHNDGALEGLLQEAMAHRDPSEVRKRTQRIHEHLYRTMPFIPLWQLDTLLAKHRDLKTVHLDPLLVFTDVAEWELKK